MNTVLVTRPPGDEKELAGRLRRRGYRVIHEPMTAICLDHTQRQALDDALAAEPDAVIVTSRHAAQAVACLSGVRDCPLVCVGEATAKAALSLGFTRVSAAGGTSAKLIEFIAAGYDEGSRFLYLSGTHIRADIAAELEARGMPTRRIPLYEAAAARHFSETLLEQVRHGGIDAATFLSPRAAAIFSSLAAEARLEQALARMHGVCLSGAIAAALDASRWKSVAAAHEATLASLLDCVDNVLA